jgi:hypothetical protein
MAQTRWPAHRYSEPRERERELGDERLFQSGVQPRTALAVVEDAGPETFGRLHGARSVEIDRGGLVRLVDLANVHRTREAWTIDGDAFVSFRGGMRPLFHHGDLHVRGSLLIDEGAWLICSGTLAVDGIVSDYRPCTLAVGGDLAARRLVATGSVIALGAVDVSEVLLAHGPSATLVVGGAIRAPLVVHHRCDVRAGSIAAEHVIDLDDVERVVALRDRFAADVISADGAIDAERCDRRLRCGLSVVR